MRNSNVFSNVFNKRISNSFEVKTHADISLMMKRYNCKARQVVNTTVDNTNTKKIKLEGDFKGSYDASNELVLPSRKKKTKIKDKGPQISRIFSKKTRKRLEQVIQKKKKKENRAALLESLSKVRQVVNTTNDNKKTKNVTIFI